MEERQHHFTVTLLWVTTLYYAACGLSAVFFPGAWLMAAALPREFEPQAQTVVGLVFGVAGVYLLTMSFAAGLAALVPNSRRPLLLVLVVGNVLDFVVTLKAVVAGSLNFISGGIFVATAAVFAALLAISYIKARLVS